MNILLLRPIPDNERFGLGPFFRIEPLETGVHLPRNPCSRCFGMDVHVRLESAFTMPRNTQKHLLSFFGKANLAIEIDEMELDRYVEHREDTVSYLGRTVSSSTVNRELSALRRGMRLAVEKKKLTTLPKFPIARETKRRKVFFTDAEFDSLLSELNEYIKPVAEVGYHTGWRVEEVISRQWKDVDFIGGWLRIDGEKAKNEEDRKFVLIPPLRAVLERQRAYTDRIEEETGAPVRWVFHRRGKRIKNFRTAWKNALRRAGLTDKQFHDFRRTAVTNLEHSQVPRTTAMKMVGHKTESIYRRYSIGYDERLKQDAEKYAAFLEKKKIKN